MNDKMKSPVECVGVVCFRGDNVLLIKRKKQPRIGEWSIPGGHIEDDETEIEAAMRELKEETGVSAKILAKIETIETDFGQGPYRLHDYLALWQAGSVHPGDDASHAEFVKLSDLETLGLWSETLRIIDKGHLILSEIEHSKNS